jgi:hypothetical protein
MKKFKFLITSIVVVFCSSSFFGQISFSHSAGGGFHISQNIALPSIMYSPRVNVFSIGEEMSLSIGTHLGIGFQGSFSSSGSSRGGGTGGSAFALAIDLPIMAELNLGNKSTPENNSIFGGFVGAGYGINRMGATGAYGNKSSGVVLNGGLRLEIRERSYGLRVGYMLNFDTDGSNVLTVGTFINF